MTWFFSDLPRHKREREALETFAATADWFSLITWRVDDKARIVLDADIIVGERTFPITLQYPDMFPDLPPSVFPRGDNSRWSSHQFGAGGELCLEYGPDNWTPDLTGLDLIKSTYKLLSTLHPAAGAPGVVASRHAESLGQSLRNIGFRFLTTSNLSAFLAALPENVMHTANVVASFHKKGATYHINKVKLLGADVWTDTSMPVTVSDEGREIEGFIFRLGTDASFPAATNLADFRNDCAALGLSFSSDPYVMLIKGEETRFYLTWEKENRVYLVPIIPPQPEQQRLDASHAALKTRSVAIIGCGSLGSKIATMLARSRVGKFVLVDDDLLMPYNFVRNDLDWRDAGSHKTDALKRRIDLVNPAATTTVWHIRLGGQQSNASAETMMTLIGDCDLIFDATANPNILSLMAAVARMKQKPVVWGEIFGGGIGGLIARCRPGIEPQPQYMRRAIENWFGEQSGAPPERSRRSYATGEEGPPFIANDADVSAIAAHAARLTIDLLIGRQPSLFPHSAYAIGLGVGSVFTQPFQTFPIQMPPPPPDEAQTELSPEDLNSEIIKIAAMFADRAK